MQRCLNIPVERTYTISSTIIFSGAPAAELKNSTALLKAAISAVLGCNVTITSIVELTARRRAPGDVEIAYSFDVTGDVALTTAIASVTTFNSDSSMQALVADLETRYMEANNGTSSTPFTAASSVGTSPSVSGGGSVGSADGKSSNGGGIAGGIVGGLLAVALLVVVVLVVRRENAKKDFAGKFSEHEAKHRPVHHINATYAPSSDTMQPMYVQPTAAANDQIIYESAAMMPGQLQPELDSSA